DEQQHQRSQHPAEVENPLPHDPPPRRVRAPPKAAELVEGRLSWLNRFTKSITQLFRGCQEGTTTIDASATPPPAVQQHAPDGPGRERAPGRAGRRRGAANIRRAGSPPMVRHRVSPLRAATIALAGCLAAAPSARAEAPSPAPAAALRDAFGQAEQALRGGERELA